jgi:hypothetical protein
VLVVGNGTTAVAAVRVTFAPMGEARSSWSMDKKLSVSEGDTTLQPIPWTPGNSQLGEKINKNSERKRKRAHSKSMTSRSYFCFRPMTLFTKDVRLVADPRLEE